MTITPELLNYEKAMARLEQVADLRTLQIATKATIAIVHRFMQQRDLPVAPVDLDFIAQVMIEFASDRRSIERILAGEDLRKDWA